MSLEQAFVIVFISAVAALVLYEIIFILYFKDAEKPKVTREVVRNVDEDVAVQSKPLGYTEPSVKKYEICSSPAFELFSEPVHRHHSEPEQTASVPFEFAPLEPSEVIHTPLPRTNSFGMAPNIVVSSEMV